MRLPLLASSAAGAQTFDEPTDDRWVELNRSDSRVTFVDYRDFNTLSRIGHVVSTWEWVAFATPEPAVEDLPAYDKSGGPGAVPV